MHLRIETNHLTSQAVEAHAQVDDVGKSSKRSRDCAFSQGTSEEREVAAQGLTLKGNIFFLQTVFVQ